MGVFGGGKGDSAPDANVQDVDLSSAMSMMQGMQSQNAEMQAALNSQPDMSTLPTTSTVESVDWTEKNKELAARAKADYGLEKAQKVGRLDTVMTSPLLDDEETSTTKSVLGGE